MAKKYGRQQFALTKKPSTNPPLGFIEIFADIDYGGRLTYLFPDGSTFVLIDTGMIDGGNVNQVYDGGTAESTEFNEIINGGGV